MDLTDCFYEVRVDFNDGRLVGLAVAEPDYAPESLAGDAATFEVTAKAKDVEVFLVLGRVERDGQEPQDLGPGTYLICPRGLFKKI